MSELSQPPAPALIVEYHDALENFKGWLVIDRLDHRICAGGMRVQPGLNLEHLVRMARNMTKKMRMTGLRVDGAKCGIDYNPADPGKKAAISRFIEAIAPYIRTSYSMGPDLNIDMTELEEAARRHGIPSVKIAIAAAQGWEQAYFLERAKILDQTVEGIPLGRLRAGYGVAAAALGLLKILDIPPQRARIAVQGFGTLAKAALFGLQEAGVRIVAVSDFEKCHITDNPRGLDVPDLLKERRNLLPESKDAETRAGRREDIFKVDCDLLIPAAIENTIPVDTARILQVKGVVPGANLAVPEAASAILFDRGIPVLPDFLAGSGGSLSMEGLFGPEDHPSPRSVLSHVKKRVIDLVNEVMEQSASSGIPPDRAALRLCENYRIQPDTRPYGRPR